MPILAILGERAIKMKYGLIGEKLGHSYSRILHQAMGNLDYELYPMDKESFFSLLKAKSFLGINVTIPYKVEALPYLDELSKEAKEIGAVNVILNQNGHLMGHNTDAYGLEAFIQKADIPLQDKKVAILGSGGTSKTAEYVAKKLGAKSIVKVSRSPKEGYVSYHNIPNDIEIIINTTPSGMFPNLDHSPLSLIGFSHLKGVVDVIYNPLRSKLVLEAQSLGIPSLGGLYMLVAQAYQSHYLFFGQYPKLSLDELYQKLLLKQQNIVLIGMPTSGKTSVGKALSTNLKLPFADVDEEVSKFLHASVPEFIKEHGIERFREIESSIVKDLSLRNGIIISTGGGSILDPKNQIHLRHNGKLYYLDRDLDHLLPEKDRPLTDSKEKLEKLYQARKGIYEEAADVIVPGNGSVQEVVEVIKKERGL